MAYDPDDQMCKDILEVRKIFKMPDRQHVYETIATAINDKAGFGVSVVGDRMTVRFYVDNKLVSAQFVLLKVDLPRDADEEEIPQ